MKGLRKMAALLLSLGLCLGLLAGCGDDVFVAKLALTGAAGTFDPQFAENKNSILVASNVFEGLLVEDPEGGLHPGVAKGYTCLLYTSSLWYCSWPPSCSLSL